MKKNPVLHSMLNHLAQKAALPGEIDLWPEIQVRLAAGKPFSQPRKPDMNHISAKNKRYWAAAFGALALVLAMALLFALPEGRALADAIRHLFRITSQEQLPKPSGEEIAAPTNVPTFMVTLAPAAAAASTPTPYPLPTSASVTMPDVCVPDLYAYACRIFWAEQSAGWDAKELPADPAGFVFKDVLIANPGEILLEYDMIGGGGYLMFSQGPGDHFPSFTGMAPESAIEEVQVGPFQGEYVVGDYAIGSQSNAYWQSCCRLRLRWLESDRWFELDKEASAPQVAYMTRDTMIQMALGLVDRPAPAQRLNPDYLASPDQAAQVAGFAVATPAVLPEGFVFKYASFNKDLSQLRLNYGPPGDAGVASILIVETPLDKVPLSPGDNGEALKGETVDINGSSAIYFSDSAYNHALTWQAAGLKITLWVSSSETGYGGGFIRAQVLGIARSLK